MYHNLPKALLIMLVCLVGWASTAMAQQIRVTGRVFDAQRNSVPGVNIVVARTSVGATTDAEGRFSLQVTSAEAKLIVSSVGFERQEIALAGRTALEITLADAPNALNEVVVVGFGTQRKVNLTGAVDQVTDKQLASRPIPSLGAGLQGLIPNLNVTVPSGQPGSAPSFNIRGFTSINGGSPLILVDNVPYSDAELSRINPNDVESISVLKDASSAAVYGARAAFGVVLITTKKGNSSKLAVSVNANMAFRTIGRAPEVVTDPYTVMDMKHQAAYPLYSLFPEAARAYAKQRSEDPSLPAVTVDPTNANKWLYTGTTDWLGEAYRSSAPTYNTSISLAQKLDKVGYYLSGDFYQQDGILRFGNDNFKRYNVRAKVDLEVTPWLTLANNTQLTSSRYDASVYMPLDGNGALFFHNVNRTSPLDVPKNPDGTWTSAGAGVFGRLQDGGRSNRGLNEFVTTFSAKASVIKSMWDIRADATFRRSAQLTRAFDIPIAYRTGPGQPLQYAGSTTSYASNANTRVDYNVLNVYSDIYKQLGSHYVQALVGFNQESNNVNTYSASRNNLISSTLPSINLSTGTMTESEAITEWAVQGLFYRLNYNYKERYLIEFNGRYDGSSRFPKNDRWGFFPSASAGWNISEESFMANVKRSARLDLLKVRASYGALGNQASVGAYDYIPTMAAGNLNELLGGAIPVVVNQPAAVASSLTWEKVSTVNLGADLAFFNNRLQLSFDKFTRYTTDMLIPGKVLPGVFGTASPRTNAGDLKTKGWELKVGWRDSKVVAGSPLAYNVSFGLGDNRSWITRFDNPTRLLSSYYVGQEIGEIWGLEALGFFQSEDEIKSHPDQKAVGTGTHGYQFTVGDIKFADTNGDGVVDRGKLTVDQPGDLRKIGNSRQRLPFNMDLSGSWKGFDARVFMQGVGQQDWYPGGGNFYFWGVYAQPWTNVTTLNADHWTPENRDAYFPRVKAYTAETGNSELGIPNNRYMQNAAYMRVKNLTLGYTLPGSLTKKAKLDQVRFYFSAENLFDVSFIKGGLDPESLSNPLTAVNYQYPFQKTYSGGLSLNF